MLWLLFDDWDLVIGYLRTILKKPDVLNEVWGLQKRLIKLE